MTVTTIDHEAELSTWFVSWFDSTYYHKLYANRDEMEAAGFIDALISRLPYRKGAFALDVGCGAGRHSRYLASRGFNVTGIDLAGSSIAEAKRWEGPGVHFIQHDMRKPFGKNVADYAFNFFTSFGYFEDPAENLNVIRNMADCLKPDGVLMLDYLNVGYAEKHLKPEELRTIDENNYILTRWSDARYFFKRIVVEDQYGRRLGEYLERVAKFSLQDFNQMFSIHGLNIEAVYGDYSLNWYDSEASPRMILIARKTQRDWLPVNAELLLAEFPAYPADGFGRQSQV